MEVLALFPNFASVKELSRHIEILLLSNDCVIVPGFGGFMAHYVDARKDERDGSFLPPMRSIGFNAKLTLNDSLLAQSYVEAYDISYPEATKRLEQEVEELKQHLELRIVNLKSKDIQQPNRAELVTLHRDSTDEDTDKERHTARVIAIWRNVAIACIAAILFILIPSPLVNNAQLAGNHIDYHLLNKVMPQEMTTAQPKITKASTPAITKKEQIDTQTTRKEHSTSASTEAAPQGKFSIVVASHVTKANAKAYSEELTSRGFKRL